MSAFQDDMVIGIPISHETTKSDRQVIPAGLQSVRCISMTVYPPASLSLDKDEEPISGISDVKAPINQR